jgi:hypothetical protein
MGAQTNTTTQEPDMTTANPNFCVYPEDALDETPVLTPEQSMRFANRGQGFWLYYDGFPITCCENAEQRAGWREAQRAAGTDGMSKAQLEAMGI